jgi:predicted GNAT family N-acyltransferase
MTVREIVFVKEQKAVTLPHHLDPDDARSCHWVFYAPASEQSLSGDSPLQPIGTIRLVPYPHGPHPERGASYEAPSRYAPVEDSETFFRHPPPKYQVDRATSLHDGKEPYLKLGRLCVVKEFRGKKLGDVLIQAALKWASENPYFGKEGTLEWKGLVCAQAQEKAVTTWQRNGFVIDEEMGSWNTVGIKHYGLFHRVNVKN